MKTFLMLYSDTGGGHRAGAEAVAAAMVERYQDEVEIHIVDGFIEQGTAVGRQIPGLFPYIIKYGRRLWDLGYRLTEKSLAEVWLRNFPLTQNWEKLLRRIEPDVIVSFHPLLTAPAIRAVAASKRKTPVYPVVLDLRSVHSTWFSTGAAAYFSPSQEASDYIRSRNGVAPIIHEFGLPLHPKFDRLQIQPSAPHTPLRVLVTGGGDGLGDLPQYLLALDEQPLAMEITVIAGRNQRLQKTLKSITYNHPVSIRGFVSNMEELVANADLVMAKAGPFAIMEAIVCLKPVLLYDFLPGLEEGNIEFVEEHQIGHFLRHPDQMHDALLSLLADYASVQTRLQSLSHPRAAYLIAEQLMRYAD